MQQTLENNIQGVNWGGSYQYTFPQSVPSTCPGCGRCNTCGRGGHETPSQSPYTQPYTWPFPYTSGTGLAGSNTPKAVTTLNSHTNSIGGQLDSSSNPMETR